MMVADGNRRLEILAAAGLSDCTNCHQTTMHFLVGDREQVHAVEASGLERSKLLVCDVCRHVYPLKDEEAARVAPGCYVRPRGPGAPRTPAPPAPRRPRARSPRRAAVRPDAVRPRARRADRNLNAHLVRQEEAGSVCARAA